MMAYQTFLMDIKVKSVNALIKAFTVSDNVPKLSLRLLSVIFSRYLIVSTLKFEERLLLYTDQTVAEIAFSLDFTDS